MRNTRRAVHDWYKELKRQELTWEQFLTEITVINDEEAKSCISKWSFKNFEKNTGIVVIFSWKHMYGWQPIQITSKGFSKTVKPNKK